MTDNRKKTTGTEIIPSQAAHAPVPFADLTLKQQRQQIQQAHGKEKYDLIFNSSKPAVMVMAMHPQELYLTINELGAEDSLDLIALATPAQITLVLDLDCWDGDQLSAEDTLHWLEFLLHCGEEKVRQLARDMDPATLALMLKKHLTITRGLEAYDDDDAENAKRLEAIYDVDYRSEDAAKTIGALIRIWQELEQDSFLQMMETLRGENLTCLEEEVYQLRNNRLLDLGIIPQTEAQAIYAYLDPQSFRTGEKKDFQLEAEKLPSPLALLKTATPRNLLAAVLEQGIEHEAACEMLHLVNRKFSADNVDLANTTQLQNALQQTYDTLNLALEYLSGNALDTATKIFDTTWLQRLFQLGHSLVVTQQRRAQQLKKSALYRYFDEPEQFFLDNLLERPAQVCFAEPDDLSAKLKPLHSMAELERVKLRLAQIEALEQLFGGPLQPLIEDLPAHRAETATLAGLLMTAVANQLLHGHLRLTPVRREDLAELARQTLSGTGISAAFAGHVHQLIASVDPACVFFVPYCLERWQEFFSSSEPAADLAESSELLLLEENKSTSR
ncbi:MAG: DUF6178 family protein [Pelovirga sp.]